MPDLFCVCTIRKGKQVILEQFPTREEAEARAEVMRDRRSIEVSVAKMTAGIKKQREK